MISKKKILTNNQKKRSLYGERISSTIIECQKAIFFFGWEKQFHITNLKELLSRNLSLQHIKFYIFAESTSFRSKRARLAEELKRPSSAKMQASSSTSFWRHMNSLPSTR